MYVYAPITHVSDMYGIHTETCHAYAMLAKLLFATLSIKHGPTLPAY